MNTQLRSIYRLQACYILLLLVAQQGSSQLLPALRSAAAPPVLSASTSCPGSLLTITSIVGIDSIQWYKDGGYLQTIKAAWKGTIVAAGNGAGNALNQFDSAVAMITDPAGNIYVSDRNNHRILKFPPSSTQVTNGVIVAGGNGQGAALNQLNKPGGLFIDNAGNLYVADMNNQRVLKFPPGSDQTTYGVVVAGGNGFGQSLLQMNSPVGVLIDNTGQLYVADRDNHRILRYPPGSNSTTPGVIVAGGNGAGPGLDQLYQPVSMLMDAAGDLYISEYKNHRVSKWTPSAPPTQGTVVAGTSGVFGNAPNLLHTPAGITFDPGNRLLIADAENHRIVRWVPGDAAGVEVINNGNGSGPDQLNAPLAVYQDISGHYIVLDALNDRILKFTPAIVPTYTAPTEGTYFAKVYTMDGLETTTSNVVINPNLTPTLSILATQYAVCDGHTATFSTQFTNAGTTPTFQWKINGIDQPGNVETFTPALLHDGDIISSTMTPSTDAGCLSQPTVSANSQVIRMYPLPAMKPTTGSNTICLQGTTQLSNATVKDSWAWLSRSPAILSVNTGSGLVTGLAAGTGVIRYIASTVMGCMDSVDITITVNPLITPTIAVTPTAQTICSGEQAGFTAAAHNAGTAPAYQWMLNGTATGVAGNTYNSKLLQQGDVITCLLTPDADAGCISSPTATSTPVTMTVNPLPVMKATTGNSILCLGATSQLSNSTIAAIGQWKSLSPSIASVTDNGLVSGLTAGTAVIRYTAHSSAGCQDSVDINVTVNALVYPTISVTPSSSSICAGGAISFTASSLAAGSNPAYQWFLNNNPAGVSGASYKPASLIQGDIVSCVLTPSNDAGCLAAPTVISTPLVITVYPLPVMAAIAGNLVVCPAATTQLTNGTNAATHAWKSLQPAVATITQGGLATALASGSATIRYMAESTAGCRDSIDALITVNPSVKPAITVLPSATLVCKGTQVNFTLSSQGAGTQPGYSWLLNGKATGVTTATYSSISLQQGDAISCVLTPSADAGCITNPSVTSAPVTITVNDPPAMAAITGNQSVCNGSSIQLSNRTPNVKGTWKSLQPSIATVSSNGLVTGLSAGTVWIRYIGTTPGGCADSTAIQITVQATITPSITISSDHNDTCAGTLVVFEANGAQGGPQPFYQWQVNGQPTTAGTRFSTSQLRQGDIVTCLLSSNAACASPVTVISNAITMAIHPLPEVNAGADKTIMKGESVLLDARLSSDIKTIQWTPVTGLQNASSATPVASPATTTTYHLEATTSHGCKATDAVTVSVITAIRIPNAFSPNGDGIHDTWELPDLQPLAAVEIQVFNRNGQAVYTARGYQPGRGWNGTYRGYVLPAGTYYYVIDLKNGKPKLSGSVTLLK